MPEQMTTENRQELTSQFKRIVAHANQILAEHGSGEIKVVPGSVEPALRARARERGTPLQGEAAIIYHDGCSYEAYLRPSAESGPLAAAVISRDIETEHVFYKDVPLDVLIRIQHCQDGDSRCLAASDGEIGFYGYVAVSLPLMEGCLSGMALLIALNSVRRTQLAADKILAEWKNSAVGQNDESAN